MKRIRGLILGALVCGFLAHAQELTKQAKIDRILDLTNANAIIDQVFKQIQTMTASMVTKDATPEQAAKAQQIQAKILDVVKARISWDKLRPAYVQIYSDMFSDDEISGILAFYESPAGRAMLAKTPALISKSMSVVQGQMGDLAPEIERITRESLQK
jgi:hypothetical protein